MSLVVRQAVQTKPDVPADLIPFRMAAAVLVHDVNLVVTHLLQTGVLFIVLVTAIVVMTELSNLVMPDAVVPAVRLLLAIMIMKIQKVEALTLLRIRLIAVMTAFVGNMATMALVSCLLALQKLQHVLLQEEQQDIVGVKWLMALLLERMHYIIVNRYKKCE